MMELWIALTFPQAIVLVAIALVICVFIVAYVWEERD